MKKFKMIDVAFKCRNCGNEVEPLGYTARDHCPKCLYSIHIDNNPGDRANTCLGDLVPVNIEKFKDSYKIIYKCNKCNEVKKNIMAQDDDFDVILKITSNLKI